MKKTEAIDLLENVLIEKEGQSVTKELGSSILKMADELKDIVKLRAGEFDIMEWIEAHRILYGKPFDFNNAEVRMDLGEYDKKLKFAPRPYFKKFLNDRSIEKSVLKCRQSEFTENEINENIYLCSTIPYFRIIHLFPTSKVGNNMAKEKISPALIKSPDIKRLLAGGNKQALSSKEFVNGSFYRIESSWSDVGGRGASCDKITFDEYESQNPEVEEIYSESTSKSKYGRRTRISTPLIPRMGIDAKYLSGCQYIWITKCKKCGKEQELLFPDNLIGIFEKQGEYLTNDKKYMEKLNQAYIGCSDCGTYIDKTGDYYLKNSRWISNRPDMIGIHNTYRVSYFMLAWKTAKEILRKYHDFRFTHQFYNEVIGIPFVAKDSNLGRDVLESNINNKILADGNFYGWFKNIAMGVDWGSGKIGSWVVIRAMGHPESKKESQIIYVEKITLESLGKMGYADTSDAGHKIRVADLIEKFRVSICINDANGIGNDRNAWLIGKYPTRVWGIYYDTAENQRQKRNLKIINPVWQPNKSIVTVSRVGEHKLALDEFRELNKIDIPFMDMDVKEYIDHLDNIIIEKMFDSKSNREYEIIAKKGADHYAHANVYARIGFFKALEKKSASYGTF